MTTIIFIFYNNKLQAASTNNFIHEELTFAGFIGLGVEAIEFQ